jgi:hypothetical protein
MSAAAAASSVVRRAAAAAGAASRGLLLARAFASGVGGEKAKRVLVPVAAGTEPIEAAATADVLNRAGARVTVATADPPGDDGLVVQAAYGVKLVADGRVADLQGESFDLIALPVRTRSPSLLGHCHHAVRQSRPCHARSQIASPSSLAFATSPFRADGQSINLCVVGRNAWVSWSQRLQSAREDGQDPRREWGPLRRHLRCASGDAGLLGHAQRPKGATLTGILCGGSAWNYVPR